MKIPRRTTTEFGINPIRRDRKEVWAAGVREADSLRGGPFDATNGKTTPLQIAVQQAKTLGGNSAERRGQYFFY